MFHAPMGRFQLEPIILPVFPPSSHLRVVCFFPIGFTLLIQHFQQVLWVLKLLLSPEKSGERPTGQKHTTVRWNDGGK